MRGIQRLFAIVLLTIAAAARGAAAQGDPRSDAYLWLQYGADGHPHARAIPSDRASCPAVTADDLGVEMTVRVVSAAGFDRVLCDATLPLAARNVSIGTAKLPPLPARIGRFIVLGDTGCRIQGAQIQDCNDARLAVRPDRSFDRGRNAAPGPYRARRRL